MDLYLIRHADAVPLGEGGATKDAQRPLSEKGEKQSAALAGQLERRGVVLDMVLTSPLVRARQTAEIMLRNWSAPAPELITCEELAPDVRPKVLAKILRRLKGERIALVGHMPDLASLTGWLLGSRSIQIEFAKAGVALVTCGFAGKALGVLQWLVTPDLLGQ